MCRGRRIFGTRIGRRAAGGSSLFSSWSSILGARELIASWGNSRGTRPGPFFRGQPCCNVLGCMYRTVGTMPVYIWLLVYHDVSQHITIFIPPARHDRWTQRSVHNVPTSFSCLVAQSPQYPDPTDASSAAAAQLHHSQRFLRPRPASSMHA